MGDENGMRRKEHESMRSGRLPDRRPDRLWGGHGNGTDLCNLCGNLLKKEEISFDLEYDGEARAARPACYSVHLHCFQAWDMDREQRNGACANQRELNLDHGRAFLPDTGDLATISGRERETLSRKL
jgi:hypothetical protein